MNHDDLEKELKDKYVYLDTCFFTKATDYLDTFVPLITLFKKVNCNPMYSEQVKFEFVRNAFRPAYQEKRTKFIEFLGATELNTLSSIANLAITIGKIYAHNKYDSKQISIVDCYNAAYIATYSKHMYLATFNHQDYPTIIFDRFYLYPLDAGKDVLTLSFSRINLQKLEAAKKALSGVK